MAFSIRFLDQPLEYLADDPSIPSAVGEIQIGDFCEEFVSVLFTWSKADYQAQWRRAIEHLLQGNDRAALITEYIDPRQSTHLRWWPMFRVDKTVYFHEQLLFFENGPEQFLRISEPFSLDRQFDYIRDRETINEDCNRISEWNVSLTELEAFASTLK